MVSLGASETLPRRVPTATGFLLHWATGPGTRWLPRVLWNMAHLLPDDLLVKCTQCDAWSMAFAENDGVGRFSRLTFRCPRCHAQEVYQVGVAGLLIPAPARNR
jgi:hypothetical protein